MSTPLRLIMLGTGDFAVPSFLALAESSPHLLALITQPGRPQGRKQEIVVSQIAARASELQIPVLQPENVNAPEFLDVVRKLEPDLLITAAYGQILSADLLSIPRLGGINLHGSILPAYRGASPVARAIQHGDQETGVTVIRMTPRIDAGGMISIGRTEIQPNETAGELEERLAALGAPLVVDAVEAIASGTYTELPQDRRIVTRAPKLKKEDGQIDWSRSSQAIHNLVRAMQPWPMAFTTWRRAGRPETEPPLRVIVHQTEPLEQGGGSPGLVLEAFADRLIVAAGQGAVRLLKLQIPGKKPASASEFLRGYRLVPGDRIGPLSTD